MSYYPPSLSYLCRKLNAYSRNRFTLYPNSLQTAGPNDVIVVQLPANALVDLHTFAMHFKLTTSAAGANNTAGPPRHIETILDSIAVEANGVMIDQASLLYGQVFKAWMDVLGADKTGQRGMLQNGALASVANVTDQPYAICNWLGFLGSAKPTCIDTSLTGPLRIYIKLAPATECAVNAESVVPSFTLNAIRFGIDILDVADGVYYSLLQKRLESGTPIEIPFDSWYTFMGNQGVMSQANTKFSLST